MNNKTRWVTGACLFLLSVAAGWLVNRPRDSETQDGKTAGDVALKTMDRPEKKPAVSDSAGGDATGSLEEEKSRGPKGKWVTVSSDLVNPTKEVRGSGLRLGIWDEIKPGSMSPKQWGAAPKDDKEFAALQDLLMKTRASLGALAPPPEMAENEGGKIKIKIGAFDSGGLKQRFLEAVTDLMGEERAAILLATSRPVLDSWLFSFGNEPTEFDIVQSPDGVLILKCAGGQSFRGWPAIKFWSESYPALAQSVENAQAIWRNAAPVKSP